MLYDIICSKPLYQTTMLYFNIKLKSNFSIKIKLISIEPSSQGFVRSVRAVLSRVFLDGFLCLQNCREQP